MTSTTAVGSAADHVRLKLSEQRDELIAHQDGARADDDPEHVHQMRVAVRRARAALKAEGASVPGAGALQAELKWLGGALGGVRDLDVQLGHLHSQTGDFTAEEKAAVEKLLHGLVVDRRAARRRMLGTLRSKRYQALLIAMAAAASSEVDSKEAGEPTASLVDVVRKPLRKLRRAAEALGEDPPDDDLHDLRIHGKRLRYSAELAVAGSPKAAKALKALIKATKGFQDLLGDHQDAVLAESEIRRLLAEMAGSAEGAEVDVVFVAGRLVERERQRRAEVRARWRAALDEVNTRAEAALR